MYYKIIVIQFSDTKETILFNTLKKIKDKLNMINYNYLGGSTNERYFIKQT